MDWFVRHMITLKYQTKEMDEYQKYVALLEFGALDFYHTSYSCDRRMPDQAYYCWLHH